MSCVSQPVPRLEKLHPTPISSSSRFVQLAEIKASIGLHLGSGRNQRKGKEKKRNNSSVTELSASPQRRHHRPQPSRRPQRHTKRACTHPKLSGNCRILAISEKPGKWKENSRNSVIIRGVRRRRNPLVLALIHQLSICRCLTGRWLENRDPLGRSMGNTRKPAHHDFDFLMAP